MKVRAVDIAKKLNLSKATVSLALNHKPGVSPATREAIFECAAEMENQKQQQAKQMIKIIGLQGEATENEEMDLWMDVYEALDRETKRMGYTLGITYSGLKQEELEAAIADANEENVAGVFVCGTELKPDQMKLFRKLKKPVAIYDNDAEGAYQCTVIDNAGIIRDAVDLLVSRGCRNIRYLGNTIDMYNFQQRKAGFRAGLWKNRLELREDSIVLVGKRIQEVYEYMMRYLQSHKLPDAFIMDNYQVSIGTMKALRELNIRVPEDVSLIGVDELPSMVMADYTLTTAKIFHAERGRSLLLLLEQEINGNLTSKFKMVSGYKLIEGNSIRKLNLPY